jgi:hypothetical protein
MNKQEASTFNFIYLLYTKRTINCIFTQLEVQRYSKGCTSRLQTTHVTRWYARATSSSSSDREAYAAAPDHKRPGHTEGKQQRAATNSVSRPRRWGHGHGRRPVPQRRRRRRRRPEAQRPPVPGLPPATGGPAAAAAGRRDGTGRDPRLIVVPRIPVTRCCIAYVSERRPDRNPKAKSSRELAVDYTERAQGADCRGGARTHEEDDHEQPS